MHLRFRNVNDAFVGLVRGIHKGSIITNSVPTRAGECLMVEEPVTVTYDQPNERVLFNEARDANPFFHLYESLWMLAGRDDVAPLVYYSGNIGSIASDDGSRFNGAYGFRWRAARGETQVIKDAEGNFRGLSTAGVDQLKVLIDHLKRKPESRRAVLAMWNVRDDLLKVDISKDVCCNLACTFSVEDGKFLNMSVFNRSNDMIWGMLGANVVHFSFLQEYIAQSLGLRVGRYHQITTNLHVYVERWEPMKWLDGYEGVRNMHSPKIHEKMYGDPWTTVNLVKDTAVFDKEVAEFVDANAAGLPSAEYRRHWEETFLDVVAQPMMNAFHFHKLREYKQALAEVSDVLADDWRLAGRNWILKRQKGWEQRVNRSSSASKESEKVE